MFNKCIYQVNILYPFNDTKYYHKLIYRVITVTKEVIANIICLEEDIT